MVEFLLLLKAVPAIAGALQELFRLIKGLTPDEKVRILRAVHELSVEVNDAKTTEERTAAAQKISQVWAQTYKPHP